MIEPEKMVTRTQSTSLSRGNSSGSREKSSTFSEKSDDEVKKPSPSSGSASVDGDNSHTSPVDGNEEEKYSHSRRSENGSSHSHSNSSRSTSGGGESKQQPAEQQQQQEESPRSVGQRQTSSSQPPSIPLVAAPTGPIRTVTSSTSSGSSSAPSDQSNNNVAPPLSIPATAASGQEDGQTTFPSLSSTPGTGNGGGSSVPAVLPSVSSSTSSSSSSSSSSTSTIGRPFRVLPPVVADPEPFPNPIIRRSHLRKVRVRITDTIIEQRLVIHSGSGKFYEIGATLKKAIFGHVIHAIQVIPSSESTSTSSASSGHSSVSSSGMPPLPPPAPQANIAPGGNNGNQAGTGAGGGGDDQLFFRTNQQMAIKVYSKRILRQLQGRTQENPLMEITALQYIGNTHPNLMGQIECCTDEENIYSIMRYCQGGELFDYIDEKGPLTNEEAKKMFRQLINGLARLQELGIGHRDMSLENILYDSMNENYVIIDFGMCLRLKKILQVAPHLLPPPPPSSSTSSNPNSASSSGSSTSTTATGPSGINTPQPIPSSESSSSSATPLPSSSASSSSSSTPLPSSSSNSSSGSSCSSSRSIPEVLPPSIDSYQYCFINKQQICGKKNYIAPEVLREDPIFNPMIADIWAAGIILFIILTGVPPIDKATHADIRYSMICEGRLQEMVTNWGIDLCEEVVDLIQKLLRSDPIERLTIAEILQHEWLKET
jgi:serine/threonine protein kinase